MDFEWDEGKSDACFAERGFDFTYAAQAFFDPDRLIRADPRYHYGEDRFQLIGAHRRAGLRARVHTTRPGHSHHLGPQGQRTRGHAP